MKDDIEPAYKDENVAIVFESSGYFVPYLSIAIQTIIDSSSSAYNYDIIVLGDGISTVDEYRICKMCKSVNNISIRIFDVKEAVNKYIENEVYSYLTVNYYRMALPWILNNYSIAINLGADIYVKEDIGTLLSYTFKNDNYLAGVKDLGYIGRLKEDISPTELDLNNPEEYINADVLIYNLSGIRCHYQIDDLMLFWQKYHFRCAEQDALNKFFDGHKELIDLKWNVFPDRMSSTQDIMCTKEQDISDWMISLKNPYIIHYAAVPKPWNYPSIGYGELWWNAARKSIYYEEIVKRMSNQELPKKTVSKYLIDKLLPKGTKRREIIKLLKPVKKWGLHSANTRGRYHEKVEQ